MKILKKVQVLFIVAVLLSIFSVVVHAQVDPTMTPTPTPQVTPTAGPTPSPDPTSQINDLNNKISDLEKKLSDEQAKERTLSSQVTLMDNQMKLTTYRISSTEQELQELSKDITTANMKISTLEQSLDAITKVLIKRIVATYQVGQVQPLQVLLTSSDINDLSNRSSYLKIAQEHDKKLIYDTEQARNDYQNQKSIFEDQKKKAEVLQQQLQAYKDQLDQEKQQKQQLLTETQGSEANYQRLIAQAQAQLAGFSRFTASQGGSSLLSNQTVCDDWGCYYNQRDSQWGGLSLDGTQYSIASDGCLVTSMAMVYTHMGHRDVTPATINALRSNFASYEPAWLNKTIVADGTTLTRISASLDSELSAGRPVIIGISYDGGPYPDHFMVVISGSNGNYRVNDPYQPNAHNVPLTDHYSVGSIRTIEKIVQQ